MSDGRVGLMYAELPIPGGEAFEAAMMDRPVTSARWLVVIGGGGRETLLGLETDGGSGGGSGWLPDATALELINALAVALRRNGWAVSVDGTGAAVMVPLADEAVTA